MGHGYTGRGGVRGDDFEARDRNALGGGHVDQNSRRIGRNLHDKLGHRGCHGVRTE